MPSAGQQTEAQWQRIREQVASVARAEFEAGREFTTGVIIGQVFTKHFPEDAISGQPTVVSFVANVRLLDFPGQPLVRDVLVANQARQLVGNSEDTPVMLQMDPTGRMTIIGRAAINTENLEIITAPVYNVDGFDLSYIYGLESVLFGDLPSAVKTALNANQTTLGLTPYTSGSKLLIGPAVRMFGASYLPGYIDIENGPRGGSAGQLSCRQVVSKVAWNDPRWRWGETPTGFPAGTVSWGLTEIETECS